jgi:ABC-2 type transport system permease protein
MIWYLTITESISLSGPLVWKAVDEDVRTGSLAGQLTKPIAYPLYRFAVTMGERIMRLGMNFAAGVVIATTLVGWVPLSTQGVLLFAIALPMALILDFLANFIVGLGAFWLEDTSGLALIYSRTSWILGGMLIPIDLFPSWLRSIVQVLPFSSMYYGPARLFVDPSMAKLIDVILRQTVACAVFYVCVALIYRAALRRVFANGG